MNRLPVLVVLVALILALAGCGGGNSTVNALLDHEFPLSLGQKATLSGQNLSVVFKEIIEDSRCPTGANCIWAGRASVVVEFEDQDGKYDMVLVQPGLSTQYVSDTYKEYSLLFKIEPYPSLETDIRSEDYRLLLTISR